MKSHWILHITSIILGQISQIIQVLRREGQRLHTYVCDNSPIPGGTSMYG
jgi:hypothetical protein